MAVKIYTGSVKDIWQEQPPTDTAFGTGRMEFRNDGSFSIFDYGRMPWAIDGKGEHLYHTSVKFFNILAREGIDTHYREDMGNRRIGIHLAKMPHRYEEIRAGETVVYRIPIECVYSRILTPASSLHRRLRTEEAQPEEYGLERPPGRGETIILPNIQTTFSTKIEATDRYDSLEQLARIGGLVGTEHQRLRELTVRAGEAVMQYGTRVGVEVADGKVEFLLGPDREFVVGDTGLSWDENRLLVQLDTGVYVDLSKQLVRDIYTITASEWKQALKQAQKEYPDDPSQWPTPPDIDKKYKDLCVEACATVSNHLAGEDVYLDLLDVAERIYNALQDLKRKYRRDETGELL